MRDPVRIEQHRGARRQFIVGPMRTETNDQHSLVVGIGRAQAQVAVVGVQAIDSRDQIDIAPMQCGQCIGLPGIAFDLHPNAQGPRQHIEVIRGKPFVIFLIGGDVQRWPVGQVDTDPQYSFVRQPLTLWCAE
ncbi:hypothetical protein D3C87_1164240 [compost metagenome]